MENENLFALLKSNDKGAFEKVIDMYQKQVFKVAHRYTNNIQDSDDITQEVFVTLYKNLHKIVSDEHLKPFIYKAAISRSLDFLRKNKIKKFFVKFSQLEAGNVENSPDVRDSQEESLLKGELNSKLLSALQTLSERQRTVFTLKNYDGLTIKEIAEITGMGDSTVKTHLFRAVQSVQSYMEKNYAK